MGSTENIITSIYKRPAIWDPKHYLHKNRSATQILWEEIAAEVGMDSATLKHKWKILKDFHRTELKRIRSLRKTLDPNEPYHSQIPPWQFFPLMNFLNDSVTSRTQYHHHHHHLPPLQSSRGDQISTGREVEENIGCDNVTMQLPDNDEAPDNESKLKDDVGKKTTDDDDDDEERREILKENIGSFLPQLWEKSDRRNQLKCDCLEKLLEIEKRRLMLCEREKDDEDEDLMFFKSFLPDIKSLPKVRKLYLKLKFQELLYNEISDSEADGANA